MKTGTLIVFEGIDGSGKSTQVEALARTLAARGCRIVTTREPTDGAYGRRIRAMATSGVHPGPDEELRWFVEDRRQHVKEVIDPALGRGATVISDRYYLSTVAYQGARGHDAARLLEESEREFPWPDLVILLEIEPAAGLARVQGRAGQAQPAFEQRAYLEQVAAIFRSLDRPYLARVDGLGPPEAVARRVLEVVDLRLGERTRGDRPPR